jgi:hypothetical protein
MSLYNYGTKILWKINYQASHMYIFISTAITFNLIYFFFVKFHTFRFILKKSATVATNCHFCSDYMISYIYLSHTHSIYAILTSLMFVTLSLVAGSQNSLMKTHSQLGLLHHTVDASLINRVSYEFKVSMDEWSELFSQTMTAKLLSLTDYEIVTKTIIIFLMKCNFTENHWWMVPDTGLQTLNHLLITLIVNYGVDCKFAINR